jgi:6-phosphogluconolactonase
MKNSKQTLFIGFFCLMNTLIFGQNANYYLYIGTYTRKTSEGLYIYQFNTKTGDFKPVSIVKGITNPSFLAITDNQRFLYALGGNKGDSVRAFSIDKQTHDLTLLNSESLAGEAGAAHVAVDKTGKWLITGNYGSGSISVLPIKTDGSLGKVTQTIKHEGQSINPERQTKPYVHSINIAPNNKDVFVADLGTDKLMAYTLNGQTGQLTASNPAFAATPQGAGPRHFTFHPNGKFAYAINELDATITGFTYKNSILETIETVNNLPEDYKGRKWAADIHISPDGKFLYASNRADHESLSIFSIHKKTGKLTLVGHQAVNGHTPRNFAIDPTGTFILVANQDSDNITIFKRDKKTGTLTATGQEIKISQPVCLKFSYHGL